MTKKIILDVDTGSDDAVALMAALLSDELEVLAACSVAGNKTIDKTTENTLRVIQAMEKDVPVYRGGPEPLFRTKSPVRIPPTHRKEMVRDGKVIQMHEEYLPLPPARGEAEEMPAAMFYVDFLRKSPEPVTIVAVGPLTNLAVALMMEPEIVKNIEEIIIMGGGYKESNSTPCSEFNIWFDAEAADWVLKSGAKLTWVPLDATHAAYITMDDCKKFRALGTVAGDVAAELIEQRILIHNDQQPLAVPDAAAVHDALALCYLLDKDVLVDVKHVHMDIGLSDYAEGQTIVDPRYYPEEPNCWFAFSGDPERFSALLLDLFKKGPKR